MKTRGFLHQPARAGLGLLGTLALSTSAHAAIDGTDDGAEGYSVAATQAHAPAWGNSNFLGNVRTVQDGTNLNVLLAGKPDNNALLLFIDSAPGGFNTISGSQISSGGEEFTINNLSGFTFETGFDADFAVRIFGNASGAFVNTYNLTTGVREYAGDCLPANISNTFIADARTIWTDNTDLATHPDGVELALDLDALGVPDGTNEVKLFAMLINGDSNFASNQMLGSQETAGTIDGGIVGYNLQTDDTATQTVPVEVTVTNPDSDGDGLDNTVEDNGGTFVDENMTGTDPNDADSDDDGLGDGDEVKNHGTDPNKPDTDGDNVNDATEVAAGTDPDDDTSEPAAGNTDIIGFDFFDYSNGGIDGQAGFEPDQFDFDNTSSTAVVNGLAQDLFVGHTTASAPWSTSFGTEVFCGELTTVNGSSASRNLNGAPTGGSANGRIENTVSSSAKVIYAKVDLTRRKNATFSGITFLNSGTEVGYAGVLGDGSGLFGTEEPNTPNSNASSLPAPDDRVVHTLVAKLDTELDLLQLFVDPASFGPGSEPFFGDAEITLGTAAVVTGIRLSSGGSGRCEWDNLVVATSWEALDDAVGTDSEPDGLRDSWEEVYSPGDLGLLTGDGDNETPADGLINSAEQDAGTDPLFGDSDGDSIGDKEEVDGSDNPWTAGVVGSPPGDPTDPCFNDSDDDGILDNEEIEAGDDNYVTNPNSQDSDGDGEDDGVELVQGTDPTDAGSSSAILGLVIPDGTLDAAYGTAIEVQTVETGFGDNANELDAAYAVIQDGKLYLMLTGNLSNDFNKLEVFFDTVGGGQNVIDNSVNNAGSNPDIDDDAYSRLAGLTFDEGFSADYHLFVRRGLSKLDLDFVELGGSGDSYIDVFGGTEEGSGSTGTGTANASPIRVGFDNSNTAGIAGGDQAADAAAAAAVTTGIELCIDLADLGNPSGEIRIAAMINNSSHGYLSNQVLGGLPAPQGSLGSDGAGNDNGNVAGIDFNNFDGEQFFRVVAPANLEIESVALVNGGTQLEIKVAKLSDGSDYVLRESPDLVTPFGAVTTAVTPGASFTASGTTQTLTVTLPAGAAGYYYRIEDAP